MNEIAELHEELSKLDKYKPKDGLARVFIQKDGNNYEMINGKVKWDQPFSDKEIKMVELLSGGNAPLFIMAASEFLKNQI